MFMLRSLLSIEVIMSAKGIDVLIIEMVNVVVIPLHVYVPPTIYLIATQATIRRHLKHGGLTPYLIAVMLLGLY